MTLKIFKAQEIWNVDFSSSGDRLVLSMPDQEQEMPQAHQSQRFATTTVLDIDRIREEADSKSTIKATKHAVKVFRGNYIIDSITKLIKLISLLNLYLLL